jgi:hypothetical protein
MHNERSRWLRYAAISFIVCVASGIFATMLAVNAGVQQGLNETPQTAGTPAVMPGAVNLLGTIATLAFLVTVVCAIIALVRWDR